MELAESLKSDGQGGHIPYQLQKFLESMKNQYLTFTKTMQEPKFRTGIEEEIEQEKMRKSELVKREKQLKAQIDNLINESLGLLNVRLNELGISAKNSPEFIEKAKGIVCSHHDLQRKKHGLENEVKQLELESDKLIKSKELELIEKLVKDRNGLRQGQARDMVRREIDMVMSGAVIGTSSRHDPKVAPLLNKLSDVTFTKCPNNANTTAIGSGAEITTQIRKRPRESNQKQRDWPEKRCRLDDPEMASRKIIEDSPMSTDPGIIHHQRKTSAATLTISPTKQQHHERSVSHPSTPVEVRKIEPISPPYQHHGPNRVSPPKASSVPSVAAAVAALNSGRSSSNVDLPKIDLTASMRANSSSKPYPPIQHQQQQQQHEAHHQPLVLPPHPDSRSRSSEHTADDLSFAKSKVSTTPRAEQFEDRLKTIIHSVLSSDAASPSESSAPASKRPPSEPLDIKPPPHLPPHGPPPTQPMFSPVKRELPVHLPPPPNTHPRGHGYPPNLPPHHPHHQQPRHHPHAAYPTTSSYGMSPYATHHSKMNMKPMPGHPPPPPPPPPTSGHPSHHHHHHMGGNGGPGSSRTMNDLIASEIERSMTSSAPQGSTAHRRPSYGPTSVVPHDPRDFPASRHPMPPSRSSPATDAHPSPASITRMSQVIEDSIRGGSGHPHHQPPPPPPPPPQAAHGYGAQHQNPARLSGGGHHRNDLEGLAVPRARSPIPQSRSRHLATSPSSSTHPAASSSSVIPTSSRNGDYPAMEGLAARFGPYMDKANREHQQRMSMKRAPSPPLSSPPVLPPKKQHLDEHPDYRYPKGG